MPTRFVVENYSTSQPLIDFRVQVHKAGGKLIVDSTFGPPPLQDPFQFGADW